MSRIATAALALVLATAATAWAQPKEPPNAREMLLAHWTDISEKLVKLAEEFPAEKYDFRPTPEIRTFADVLRHVAFWNQFVAKNARGEKADGKANELAKAEYGTKPAIVAALKSSLAEATAELKKQPVSPPVKVMDLYTAFVGHSGEHYGQLVVYFRLNKLVPPASR